MYRLAFTANWNWTGVASRHRWNISAVGKR
jgi:hypothetical protein